MNNELDDVLPKKDSWHKCYQNGALLTDYQASILKRNGINPNEHINAILMEINDILLEEENPELEAISREIDEMNYYKSQKN